MEKETLKKTEVTKCWVNEREEIEQRGLMFDAAISESVKAALVKNGFSQTWVDGKRHFIAITRDKDYDKVYIDGELVTANKKETYFKQLNNLLMFGIVCHEPYKPKGRLVKQPSYTALNDGFKSKKVY